MTMSTMLKVRRLPVLLVILDGFGASLSKANNAVAIAPVKGVAA